jgi:hypothetical protein
VQLLAFLGGQGDLVLLHAGSSQRGEPFRRTDAASLCNSKVANY